MPKKEQRRGRVVAKRKAALVAENEVRRRRNIFRRYLAWQQRQRGADPNLVMRIQRELARG